tara:strand:- start:6854 stop:7972 length:1119 start_codon:yes stop_codon:yes gene_type:complete
MKKNKKILLLHSSNDLYGASKVFLQIIQILNQQGYETHIILPFKGPLDDLIDTNSCKLQHYNLGVLRKKYFNIVGLINRAYKNLKSICFLSNYIKKNDICTVYTNTSTIISGGLAAKINNISSFVHIHEIPTNKLYFLISKKLINIISNKIIVVSNAVKIYWNFRCDSKVNLIFNGFDVSSNKKETKKLKKDFVFTNIARLIPYKGHLYLLSIAKKLIEYNPNFIFNIIGDTFNGYKNYELSLKNYLVKNGLENNIFFLGFKNDVFTYLSKSDFFIHSAVEPDPFPTVIIESIISSVPVISTNLGGAVEILDKGKGGLLIPVNDVEKSVSLILNFLEKEKEILQKKSYAEQYLKKNFSKNQFRHNILSLFND